MAKKSDNMLMYMAAAVGGLWWYTHKQAGDAATIPGAADPLSDQYVTANTPSGQSILSTQPNPLAMTGGLTYVLPPVAPLAPTPTPTLTPTPITVPDTSNCQQTPYGLVCPSIFTPTPTPPITPPATVGPMTVSISVLSIDPVAATQWGTGQIYHLQADVAGGNAPYAYNWSANPAVAAGNDSAEGKKTFFFKAQGVSSITVSVNVSSPGLATVAASKVI